jgi:hypothetical protein
MAMAATCNRELNRLFHVAAPAANQQQTLAYRLLSQGDPDSAMRVAARLGRVFEFLQAPVEIAGIDRPDKGVDHRRDPLRLARRDRAAGQRRGHRLHRRSDVVGLQPRALSRGGALDRRQCESYRAFAARRRDAFEAKPHRSRVAGESELDRPARQRLGLTRQKCRRGKRRLVARAGLSPGGIARPPLLVRPPTVVPCPCSPCFIWFRSGIRNSFHHNLAPDDGLDCLGSYNAIVVIARWSMTLCPNIRRDSTQ